MNRSRRYRANRTPMGRAPVPGFQLPIPGFSPGKGAAGVVVRCLTGHHNAAILRHVPAGCQALWSVLMSSHFVETTLAKKTSKLTVHPAICMKIKGRTKIRPIPALDSRFFPRERSRWQKDVKSADRSGDIYENKGSRDIMTDLKGRICPTQSGVLSIQTPFAGAF